LQSGLPLALALTYPGSFGTLSSISGVISEQNQLSVLLPLTLITVSGLANLLYFTPLVNKTMKERLHQESIDGKKSYDAPPHSQKMTELNKKFGKLHGLSTLINLGAVIATLAYGVVLGGRLQ
jgi:p-aminobenzoyl-glutamate transporter AbgT